MYTHFPHPLLNKRTHKKSHNRTKTWMSSDHLCHGSVRMRTVQPILIHKLCWPVVHDYYGPSPWETLAQRLVYASEVGSYLRGAPNGACSLSWHLVFGSKVIVNEDMFRIEHSSLFLLEKCLALGTVLLWRSWRWLSVITIVSNFLEENVMIFWSWLQWYCITMKFNGIVHGCFY